MNAVTLAEAQETLAAVADDLGISIGATTSGKFGGDILLLSLVFRPADYRVSWPGGTWFNTPAEAARLIRGYAKRNNISLSRAASQWTEARGHGLSTIADFAIVEPVGESIAEMARWRTAEGQAALVSAAAAEGGTVELGEYAPENDEGGYRLLDAVNVEARGAVIASTAFEEYQRQLSDALTGGAA